MSNLILYKFAINYCEGLIPYISSPKASWLCGAAAIWQISRKSTLGSIAGAVAIAATFFLRAREQVTVENFEERLDKLGRDIAVSLQDNFFHLKRALYRNRYDRIRNVVQQNRNQIPNIAVYETLDSLRPLLEQRTANSLKEAYQALLLENEQERRVFTIPERRICNFSGNDAIDLVRGARRMVFIADQEILHKHPMRFLPRSPFMQKSREGFEETEKRYFESLGDNGAKWFPLLLGTEKRVRAVAVTEERKHVILQQAIRSCLPTCVAMLLLDKKKMPNFRLCQSVENGKRESAQKWIDDAGLASEAVTLPKEKHQIIPFLIERLQMYGPGILNIEHPDIKSHSIVLDTVSLKDNTATIRDPFHGWMVTIRLGELLNWMDPTSSFLQIIN